MPLPMKRTICLLFVILLSPNLFAWGPTGHRAVGRIAEKYMSEKAKAAVSLILNGQSVAMAGTWMDEIRSDSLYDFMEDWHWVTIPAGKTYEQSEKNPNGDIIFAIERAISELKSGKLSRQKEIEALKILIHLVGDIHQPLHVGARDDRGGNNVKVNWFRSESNLHRVWDSDMIDDSKLSYTELAESMDTPAPDVVAKWQAVPVREWAKESQSYEKQVYDIGNGRLGYEYSYRNWGLVRQRLLQAGVRLAGVLNAIYG